MLFSFSKQAELPDYVIGLKGQNSLPPVNPVQPEDRYEEYDYPDFPYAGEISLIQGFVWKV
jgi:hypothetical protein